MVIDAIRLMKEGCNSETNRWMRVRSIRSDLKMTDGRRKEKTREEKRRRDKKGEEEMEPERRRSDGCSARTGSETIQTEEG